MFLFVAVCLTSCINYTSDGVVEESSDNNRFAVTRFEFDGHKYIKFEDRDDISRSYDHGVGYVHDPDCWCKRDSTYEIVVDGKTYILK